MKTILLFIFLFCSVYGGEYYHEGVEVTLPSHDAMEQRAVSLEIVVGLRGDDGDAVEALCDRYGLELVERLTPLLFVARVKERASAVHVSQMLGEDEHVLFAHPNFVHKVQAR